MFLATWKDIPNDNESQFQIKDCHLNSGNGGCKRHAVQPYPPATPYGYQPESRREIVCDEKLSTTVTVCVRDNLVPHKRESS